MPGNPLKGVSGYTKATPTYGYRRPAECKNCFRNDILEE
jgi:hypothetical protein